MVHEFRKTELPVAELLGMERGREEKNGKNMLIPLLKEKKEGKNTLESINQSQVTFFGFLSCDTFPKVA